MYMSDKNTEKKKCDDEIKRKQKMINDKNTEKARCENYNREELKKRLNSVEMKQKREKLGSAFGIIMIIFSSIQYLIINERLNEKMNPNVPSLEKLPIIYVILALGILYLQYNK